MADWPDLSMLKQELGEDRSDKDVLLQQALDAAVEQVQVDVGVPVDEPSASLQQAALLLAVTAAKAPEAPFGVAGVFDTSAIYVSTKNPNYWRLIKGHRVRFGLA